MTSAPQAENTVRQIALLQMTAGDDVAANLSAIADHVSSATSKGALAVFLPECCALMQTSRAQLRATAKAEEDGPIQLALADIARRNAIWLFAGSIPVASADPDRVYNSSVVFTPKGEAIARYHKAHLFDVSLENGEQYLESAYTMAGDRLCLVDSVLGRIGLSVCYDLRFPELYRALVADGAEVLLVPSAFSVTTGEAHWHALLRARAIENCCYVVAAAQWGTHPSGRKTYGHSIVIDPWGRVVAEKTTGTGLLMAEIDRNEVKRARQQLPCLNHRKSWL